MHLKRIPRLFLTISLYLLSLTVKAQVQSYQITDSFGKHFFEQVPTRVVVTDWALLDNLLALGVEPVGAPELTLFQEKRNHPNFPQGITDIGLRHAPNLARIEALKPDVIILGTGQKELARPFSRISKVVYYKNFSERYRNHGEKSRERFLQLAELFQQQGLAEEKLKIQDQKLTQLRNQLQQRYAQKSALQSKAELPELALATPINSRTLLIYGQSSMPGYTLQQLGLPVSREKWNSAKQPETQFSLSALDNKNCRHLMLFETVYPFRDWYQSSAWQELPGVVQQCMKDVSSIYPMWPYGGAMSIGDMAELVVAHLLAKPDSDNRP